MDRQRGFTLVEVIVAIGIFALLGLGCYRVLHGLSLARDTLTRSAGEQRKFLRAMMVINSDFTQLTPRKILDGSGRTVAALDTHDDYLVEFSRIGVPNPLLLKRAKVARVAYRFSKEFTIDTFQLDDSVPSKNAALKEAVGDGKQGYLVRYTWPVLDRGKDENPQVQIVMSGVNDFQMEFMDDKQHWGDEWPVIGAQTAAGLIELPYAIRIKLDTKKYGVLERVFQIRDLPPLQHT
jgi:general secretion pathway protein J